jgi:transcriptional regulator with XRE-family HTH domain
MPAERIKHFRKIRGFTQEQFSFETGLSQSQISKYEKGSHIPCAELLKRFAKVLEIEAFEFIYNTESELEEAIVRYMQKKKRS